MIFPLNAPDILGYDREQVEALLARVKTQYQNPNRTLITSAMLAVVKFDLVPGGYQIPAVDDALARVADTFDEREIKDRLAKEGRVALVGELTAMLNIIRPVLEKKPSECFPGSATASAASSSLVCSSRSRLSAGKCLPLRPISSAQCPLVVLDQGLIAVRSKSFWLW